MFQTTTHGTIYQISSQRSLEWKPKEKNIQIPIWLDSDTHYLPKSKDSDTQVPQDRIRWSLSFDLVKTLLGSISTLEVNIAQAIASHRSQCHTLCHPRGKSLVDSLASWQASENSLGLLGIQHFVFGHHGPFSSLIYLWHRLICESYVSFRS